MVTYSTYNEMHLGDNLWHLQFMRGLAKIYPEHRFIHAAGYGYLPQLIECVCDLPNISLVDLEHRPPDAINSWTNDEGRFENDPDAFDIAGFLIRHFAHLAGKFGLDSPIRQPSDLRYDYPAILRYDTPPFDVLVVNSPPLSGQFQSFRPEDFDMLIGLLLERGYSVISTARSAHKVPYTQGLSLSVSAIGSLSRFCRYIIGIPNGPMWPTFNVWNAETVKLRLLLLDNGHKVLFSPNTMHVQDIPQAIGILRAEGIL